MSAMRELIACSQFTALNGASSAIHNMAAAYNAETKEARIYTEFERVDERVIADSLRNKGIGSVIIDSFSSEAPYVQYLLATA